MEPSVHEPVTQPSPSSPPSTNDGVEAKSPAATTTTATLATTTIAAARPERNSVVPPYWRKHDRNVSRLSSYSASDNGHPTPIGMVDHTDEDSEQCKVLWAKGVTIDDYVVVSGTAPGLGAYVVWNCTVETLDGGPMKIRKRYSEFEDLRAKLAQTFPHAVGSMPQFPPKSVISRFRPRFLERRKQGLSFFLNCVLLNPEFAGSPVLKEFLFS